MDPDQARKLGDYLREARHAAGLSAIALGELTNMNDATIIRFENGKMASPAPDKLARIADALELPLADVFALADYASPRDLPSFTPYLRTKYRDLPEDAAEQIEKYVARVAKKHGVTLEGPAPGEDES
jgi:transcriptional regulator with XRE-family HTH domain